MCVCVCVCVCVVCAACLPSSLPPSVSLFSMQSPPALAAYDEFKDTRARERLSISPQYPPLPSVSLSLSQDTLSPPLIPTTVIIPAAPMSMGREAGMDGGREGGREGGGEGGRESAHETERERQRERARERLREGGDIESLLKVTVWCRSLGST
jgi:hypothetical protein